MQGPPVRVLSPVDLTRGVPARIVRGSFWVQHPAHDGPACLAWTCAEPEPYRLRPVQDAQSLLFQRVRMRWYIRMGAGYIWSRY